MMNGQDVIVLGQQLIRALFLFVKPKAPEIHPVPMKPLELSSAGPAARTPTAAPATAITAAPVALPSTGAAGMPTTEETIIELKKRLAKELYRMELDLQNGGRIAGKPCDCLSSKHHFGIEATAEELMSYDTSPIYQQIIRWNDEHAPVFEPAVVAENPVEYYQTMAPELRDFRKLVMGTEDPMAILTNQDKVVFAERLLEKRREQQEVAVEEEAPAEA